MRTVLITMIAFMVALGYVDNAEAAKPKKGKGAQTSAPAGEEKGKGKAEAGPEKLELAETGVSDLDAFFAKAKTPVDSIVDADTKVIGVRTTLATALGLPEGTPFADALADLKTKADGKLTVAMNDKGVPTLSPTDAMPENVQAAVDSLNASLDEAGEAVSALSALPDQFKALSDEGAELPGKMPSMGIKPLDIPKHTKTVKGNLDTLSKAPGKIKDLADSFSALTGDITSTFGA